MTLVRIMLFSAACLAVSLATTKMPAYHLRPIKDAAPRILAVVIEGKPNPKFLQPQLAMAGNNRVTVRSGTTTRRRAPVGAGSATTKEPVAPLLFGIGDDLFLFNPDWAIGSFDSMLNMNSYQQPQQRPNSWLNIPGVIPRELLFPASFYFQKPLEQRATSTIILSGASSTSPTIVCNDYSYRIPADNIWSYRCCGHDIYYYPTQSCSVPATMPVTTRSPRISSPLGASTSAMDYVWVQAPPFSTPISCNGIRYYVASVYAASYTCCGTALIDSAIGVCG